MVLEQRIVVFSRAEVQLPERAARNVDDPSSFRGANLWCQKCCEQEVAELASTDLVSGSSAYNSTTTHMCRSKLQLKPIHTLLLRARHNRRIVHQHIDSFYLLVPHNLLCPASSAGETAEIHFDFENVDLGVDGTNGFGSLGELCRGPADEYEGCGMGGG